MADKSLNALRKISMHSGGRPYPLLSSITIEATSGSGLRGIKRLHIDLDFPIKMVSGINGSGKSTLLALAALAFHGCDGHIPIGSSQRQKNTHRPSGYFTFKDFFHAGPGEADARGIEIEWQYSNGRRPLRIKKTTHKWMHYDRRPARPVEFIGLARALPAFEMPALRHNFGKRAIASRVPLSEKANHHISKILGHEQYGIERLERRSKYSIRKTKRAGGYTSFNMGSGEDAVIDLVAVIDRAPAGALIVIEELEAALHPAAQKKLVDALLDLALEKKLQIVGSTHSGHVVDALPQEACVLLQKNGTDHSVIPEPSTHLALADLTASNQPELLIICEDETASTVIKMLLLHNLRRRVEVMPAGTKNRIAVSAEILKRVHGDSKILVVWDGDVSTEEAEGYVEEAKIKNGTTPSKFDLPFWILPGAGLRPEQWLLEMVRNEAFADACTALGYENDGELVRLLDRCGVAEHHRIIQMIAEGASLDIGHTCGLVARCAATNAPQAREALARKVTEVLEETDQPPV